MVVKRARGPRGKAKEMSSETEKEEPQGEVERNLRSPKRILRRCVPCEFPSLPAIVFLVLVLLVKLCVYGGRRGKAPLTYSRRSLAVIALAGLFFLSLKTEANCLRS
jgi:hypothetical protein